MSAEPVTWFSVTSGRFTGVLGMIAAAVVLVIAVVEQGPPGAYVAGLLVALLSWLVLLRPRVGTRGSDLLLRGMVSTVVVPLAAVERVDVRQVLVVWAHERRHVSAAIGHTFRHINRQRRAGGQVDVVGGDSVAASALQQPYADHVRDMIYERSREARRDGGPGGEARREWAVPELAALAVLVVAALVLLVV